MYKKYTHITADEETKIRREAAYSGIKGGAEIVLDNLEKSRKEAGRPPVKQPTRFTHWREL